MHASLTGAQLSKTRSAQSSSEVSLCPATSQPPVALRHGSLWEEGRRPRSGTAEVGEPWAGWEVHGGCSQSGDGGLRPDQISPCPTPRPTALRVSFSLWVPHQKAELLSRAPTPPSTTKEEKKFYSPI